MASGRSSGYPAAMASAWGVSMSRLAASISSVVVSPLPHSLAIRRNGALVTPAMGARGGGCADLHRADFQTRGLRRGRG